MLTFQCKDKVYCSHLSWWRWFEYEPLLHMTSSYNEVKIITVVFLDFWHELLSLLGCLAIANVKAQYIYFVSFWGTPKVSCQEKHDSERHLRAGYLQKCLTKPHFSLHPAQLKILSTITVRIERKPSSQERYSAISLVNRKLSLNNSARGII